MPIKNQKLLDRHTKINKSLYGKGIVNTAREVMRLLDTPEYSDFDCHKIIRDANKNIKAGSSSGEQANAVASIIYHCHSRGEEFEEKWG